MTWLSFIAGACFGALSCLLLALCALVYFLAHSEEDFHLINADEMQPIAPDKVPGGSLD